MQNIQEITINHALLFSGNVRTRRYFAAFAARNSFFFSSELIHKAFLAETDIATKSWLALALGTSGYIYAKQDLRQWGQYEDTGEEDRFWGLIGSNLISNEQNYNDALQKVFSSDRLTVTSGLIESYHHPFKCDYYLNVIGNSLVSGDALKERWALVAISNCKNFTNWELVTDLLKHSNEAITREWAAWAISASCNKNIDNKLFEYIEIEQNNRVREWLYKAILVRNNNLSPDYVKEVFLHEKDYMVKEGIVQSILKDESKTNISIIKDFVLDFFDTGCVINSPEHEILISQALKVFNLEPITSDELRTLIGIAKVASKHLKFTTCSIAKNQLQNLGVAYRSGIYEGIGQLVEQELDTFEDINFWDVRLNKLLPIILSEELSQHYTGKLRNDISQRAIIVIPGRQSNVRIIQTIEDVVSDKDIIQSVSGIII